MHCLGQVSDAKFDSWNGTLLMQKSMSRIVKAEINAKGLKNSEPPDLVRVLIPSSVFFPAKID